MIYWLDRSAYSFHEPIAEGSRYYQPDPYLVHSVDTPGDLEADERAFLVPSFGCC